MDAQNPNMNLQDHHDMDPQDSNNFDAHNYSTDTQSNDTSMQGLNPTAQSFDMNTQNFSAGVQDFRMHEQSHNVNMQDPTAMPPSSAAVLGAVFPVRHIACFKDLVGMDQGERLRLDVANHTIQIKSSQPDPTWNFIMSAAIFQTFAPSAFTQAHPVPLVCPEQLESELSVLVLPAGILDFQAVQHIFDWMVRVCRTRKAFALPVPENFFICVELLKVAQFLAIGVAEKRSWGVLARMISNIDLEWQHLHSVMASFPPDSKIVKHLVHNVHFRQTQNSLTPSAQHFIMGNRFFSELLGQVSFARKVLIAESMSKTKENRDGNSEQQGYSQPWDGPGQQQPWRKNNRYPTNNNALKGNGKKNAPHQHFDHDFSRDPNQPATPGHPGGHFNAGFNQNLQRTFQQNVQMWGSSPSAHEGGAYDVRALNPGEATACGFIA